METEEYVIVTTVSSYRMRYCIPVSELRKLNEEVEPNSTDLLEWARDCVTCEQVKEFSQEWIGEQIIDSRKMSEEEAIELFDQDNQYLSGWEKGFKVRYMKEWKDTIPG